MKKFKLRQILLFLILALSAAGCGGTGGSSAHTDESTSPMEAELSGDADTDEYIRARNSRVKNEQSRELPISFLDGAAGNTEKTYTVMIYMIGSDLESQIGAATRDLQEIQMSGVDFEQVNVLVYTGGSARWNTNVPTETSTVLDLSKSAEDWIVASTEEAADMGDSSNLRNFVNFCQANYPAEHNALIFWDHGGGPLMGYGSDELFGGDGLLLAEMNEAMQQTGYTEKNKLDWVGFDACLMGSYENMRLWQNYAEYFVGSEETEPGNGWDYSFLKILNEERDPEAVVSAAVETYGAFYAAAVTESYDPDVTLSAVNLSGMNALDQALSTLSGELDADVNTNFASLQKIRTSSRSFGMIRTSDDSEYSYDLVDMGDFAAQMEETYPSAQAVTEALADMVVSNSTNVENACGVSIYYPCANKALYSAMGDVYTETAANEAYVNYVDRLTGQWMSDHATDWDAPTLTKENGEWTAPLTEEQQAGITDSYYTILCKNSSLGTYYPVLYAVSADPDENGIIHIDGDPHLATMHNESGDWCVWPAQEISRTSKYVTYQTTLNTSLLTGRLADISLCKYETAAITFSGKIGENILKIKDVSSRGEVLGMSGKTSLDIRDYDYLYYSYQGLLPARLSPDTYASVEDWEYGDEATYSLLPVDRTMEMSMVPVSELEGKYYLQLTLVDAYGKRYASEPVLLESEKAYQTVTQSTDHGQIVYAVFEDHAEVMQYSGQDTIVEIPAEINGTPVTVISGGAFFKEIFFSEHGSRIVEKVALPDTITDIEESAFRNCPNLVEINLPESLTSIGTEAFADSDGLSELVIPSDVKSIGKWAFAECDNLTSLAIPSDIEYIGEGIVENCHSLRKLELYGKQPEHYVCEDGVLYSEDGQMIALTDYSLESITIPKGVTSIGHSACYGAEQLKTVILPDGLETIGNFAFFGCLDLQIPKFPESLSVIGMHAFNNDGYKAVYDFTEEQIKQISIGKNLVSIGEDAFANLMPRTFFVDEKNPVYSSVDGALMNKTGDTLIAYAVTTPHEISIPDGCVSLNMNLFQSPPFGEFFDDTYITDIYVPDSIQWISGDVSETAADQITLHCPKDGVVDVYAQGQGIRTIDSTDDFVGTREVTTDRGTLQFTLYKQHAAWTDYDGTDTQIDIPAEVDGLPVTQVGDGISAVLYTEDTGINHSEDVTISLPGCVTRIEDNAFRYISNVKSMELPDSIEYIGSNFVDKDAYPDGFRIPSALKDFNTGTLNRMTAYIANEENENFTVIDGMLYTADGKTLLAVPYLDESVTKLVIPDGTETLGDSTLNHMSTLETLVMPDSVTEIGDSVLRSCSSLTEIQWSKNLKKIGKSSVCSLSALETLALPDSLETIDAGSVYDCPALTELSLPTGLVSIGISVFSRLPLVTDITLPDSLESIGYSAFSKSGYTVETLELGSALKEFEPDVLANLHPQNIRVSADNESYSSMDGMLTDKSGTVLIQYPSGADEQEVHLPEEIRQIRSYAFGGCEITDLYIPESVEYISNSALDTSMSWDPITVSVHGAPGSAAERFCLENDVTFAADVP